MYWYGYNRLSISISIVFKTDHTLSGKSICKRANKVILVAYKFASIPQSNVK